MEESVELHPVSGEYKNNIIFTVFITTITYRFVTSGKFSTGPFRDQFSGECEEYNNYIQTKKRITELQNDCLNMIINKFGLSAAVLNHTEINIYYTPEFQSFQKNFKYDRKREYKSTVGSNLKITIKEHCVTQLDYITYYLKNEREFVRSVVIFQKYSLDIGYAAANISYKDPYSNSQQFYNYQYLLNMYGRSLKCLGYKTIFARLAHHLLYKYKQNNNYNKKNTIVIEHPCLKVNEIFNLTKKELNSICVSSDEYLSEKEQMISFVGKFEFDRCLRLIQDTLIITDKNDPWQKYALNKYRDIYKAYDLTYLGWTPSLYLVTGEAFFMSLKDMSTNYDNVLKLCLNANLKSTPNKPCLQNMYLVAILGILYKYSNELVSYTEIKKGAFHDDKYYINKITAKKELAEYLKAKSENYNKYFTPVGKKLGITFGVMFLISALIIIAWFTTTKLQKRRQQKKVVPL